MEEDKRSSSSEEQESGGSIQPISSRYLSSAQAMDLIYRDMVNHYYWTEDWTPETYIRFFSCSSTDLLALPTVVLSVFPWTKATQLICYLKSKSLTHFLTGMIFICLEQ